MSSMAEFNAANPLEILQPSPVSSFLKVYCDASWSMDSRRSGSCVNGSASPVLEAEAKAAILAMQTALSRNLDNVLFESDSASLVQYINGDI